METKQKCILIDIDGTLVDISVRKELGKPFIVKEEDLHLYTLDTVKPEVAMAIKLFYNEGYEIIFCSGRTEMGREATLLQIDSCTQAVEKRGFEFPILYMRRDGDLRKDSVVKSEFISTIKQEYDIFFALDDRDQVVEYYRSVGITCWQVAPGNF